MTIKQSYKEAKKATQKLTNEIAKELKQNLDYNALNHKIMTEFEKATNFNEKIADLKTEFKDHSKEIEKFAKRTKDAQLKRIHDLLGIFNKKSTEYSHVLHDSHIVKEDMSLLKSILKETYGIFKYTVNEIKNYLSSADAKNLTSKISGETYKYFDIAAKQFNEDFESFKQELQKAVHNYKKKKTTRK
jgi:hypothetical protein